MSVLWTFRENKQKVNKLAKAALYSPQTDLAIL